MEDRLEGSAIRRPGPASLALAVILVTTAAWWTLALWPAGNAPAAWLVQTRAVCFGARAGGSPDFGGWMFLLGEPVGMIAVLAVIGGRSLAADLLGVGQWLGRSRMVWTAVPALVLFAVIAGSGMAARPRTGSDGVLPDSPSTVVDFAAPATMLVDEHGSSISLGGLKQPSIVTVAFAHCEIVCPTTVRHVMSARVAAGRPGIPLFIVTVDPWRDTAERLPTIAHQWALTASDHVLSGDVAAVERTLDALGVGRTRDPNTGNIAHAVVVLLLDGRGRVTQRLEGDTDRLTALLVAAR